jgi:hypothetical protein
MKVQHDLVLQ